MAKPTGRINFCCIAHDQVLKNDDGKPFNLQYDTFQDAWNSKDLREIRRKMVEGKQVNGCETCYFQEKIGKESYRHLHNREWSNKIGYDRITDLVNDAKENDFNVNEPPVYLDLRLGNLCNLKCRMCNPYNSTQIHKEWNELDQKTDGKYSEFWKEFGMQNSSIEPWYESEVFWKSVEDMIPNLEKVYLTGGEPTLIAGNYRFLQKCVDMGYANNIELFFNTNATNVLSKFIEQINHFKWTSINVSIDAYGDLNDYIRSSSNWKKINDNLHKLIFETGGNVGIGVTPVIQIYNTLDIVDLLEHIELIDRQTEKEILIDFLYCNDPPFLHPNLIPDEARKIAIERLEKFKSNSRMMMNNSDRYSFIRNGVNSMINMLNGPKQENDKALLEKFLTHTEFLDFSRGTSFQKAVPKLEGIIRKYVTE